MQEYDSALVGRVSPDGFDGDPQAAWDAYASLAGDRLN